MTARGSRCFGNESLDILYNGVVIRKDEGCINDVHTYVADAVFNGAVTYEWTIDGIYRPDNPGLHPIVSTSATYSYTFDDKSHTIYLVAKTESCGIQVTLPVKGKICLPECPIACVTETVDIPMGFVQGLTDNKNNFHKVQGSYSFGCGKTLTKEALKALKVLNDKTANIILAMLKSYPNCAQAPISVKWVYNESSKCITLTISNSPIKFNSITVDGNIYQFNTTYC